MTNQELHEEIICLGNELMELEVKRAGLEVKLEELKKAIEGDGGVFKPRDEQNYWFIENADRVLQEKWDNFSFDKNLYAIGNCFPTEEAAKDRVRVLKLIQKARESQDGFIPDWENGEQDKYSLNFNRSYIDTAVCNLLDIAPIFGYWKNEPVCEEFITENHDELIWFFMEYSRQ